MRNSILLPPAACVVVLGVVAICDACLLAIICFRNAILLADFVGSGVDGVDVVLCEASRLAIICLRKAALLDGSVVTISCGVNIFVVIVVVSFVVVEVVCLLSLLLFIR